MTTDYSAPAGAPCWIDLMTTDPERSTAFYQALFGWTSESAGEEFGGYITFSRDGAFVAGAMRNDPQWNAPDAWSVYLKSDDIEVTLKAVAAAGGTEVVPAMAIGAIGHMAVVTDPSGAAIGIWQPGSGPEAHTGFHAVAEPGAPGWFELHTNAFASAVAFYESAFGWDTHVVGDTDEFRYTTLGEGEEQKAGVMDAKNFLPEGVPSQWSVYFQVADADAAVAQAVELGASVVHPAEDTPYGRLVELTDPTGARFKLIADI